MKRSLSSWKGLQQPQKHPSPDNAHPPHFYVYMYCPRKLLLFFVSVWRIGWCCCHGSRLLSILTHFFRLAAEISCRHLSALWPEDQLQDVDELCFSSFLMRRQLSRVPYLSRTRLYTHPNALVMSRPDTLSTYNICHIGNGWSFPCCIHASVSSLRPHYSSPLFLAPAVVMTPIMRMMFVAATGGYQLTTRWTNNPATMQAWRTVVAWPEEGRKEGYWKRAPVTWTNAPVTCSCVQMMRVTAREIKLHIGLTHILYRLLQSFCFLALLLPCNFDPRFFSDRPPSDGKKRVVTLPYLYLSDHVWMGYTLDTYPVPIHRHKHAKGPACMGA